MDPLTTGMIAGGISEVGNLLGLGSLGGSTRKQARKLEEAGVAHSQLYRTMGLGHPEGIGVYLYLGGQPAMLANVFESEEAAQNYIDNLPYPYKQNVKAMPVSATGAAGEYQPYKEAGLKGLEEYTSAVTGEGYEGFKTSPGYQWLVDEMMRQTNRGQIAEGAYGGRRDAALMERAQGLASQEFDKYLNNLQSLISIGQNATGALENLRYGYETNALNTRMGGVQAGAELSSQAIPAKSALLSTAFNLPQNIYDIYTQGKQTQSLEKIASSFSVK